MLAVERKGHSGDPGLSRLRQTGPSSGPRTEQIRVRLLRTRPTLSLLSLSDAQVGQSSSPGPSQRVRKGSEHMCVVVLHWFFTLITSLQSKVLSIAAITVLMAFVLPLPYNPLSTDLH